MPTAAARKQLDEMAAEIIELATLIFTTRARARPGKTEELTEVEFLVLDHLSREQPLTVGEVQKRIGVLPAQMSRIVRSLEQKVGGMVKCRINPADKRKIDLSLTTAGRNAHRDYRSARLNSVKAILAVLKPRDRMEFVRMLGEIREGISQRLSDN